MGVHPRRCGSPQMRQLLERGNNTTIAQCRGGLEVPSTVPSSNASVLLIPYSGKEFYRADAVAIF
jgi:hypothetical protein